MEITVSQLAALLDATVRSGELNAVLTGFATLREAGSGDISFFGNERYLPDLRKTRAGAVLVPDAFDGDIDGVALLSVANPSAAFAEVVKRFTPPPRAFRPGIHPSAVVDPSAVLNPAAVCIGPNAVISAGVEIGDGSEIGALSFVGEGAKLGKGCLMHPRASLNDGCIAGDRVILHSGVVIGSDGFGFEFVNGRHAKIPQVGIVVLEDDVEVGANSTIDRARFGRTVIGEGSKIDNLVQIAHNVVIGKHCIVVALVGIAGSAKIGDYTVIAAQAGVAGHITVAPKCVIAARSGITKSIKEPGQYMGFPATTVAEARRQMVGQRKLPSMLERLGKLEKHTGLKRPPEA